MKLCSTKLGFKDQCRSNKLSKKFLIMTVTFYMYSLETCLIVLEYNLNSALLSLFSIW